MAREGGGFKPEYFSELASLEEDNFWFQARNAIIVWALRKYMPRATKFLEVGCGTGFVLSGVAEAFPDIALTGSEVFCDGLFYAARRVPNATFMQMDARRVPFEEEFDVIGAFDVLEHIKEDHIVTAQLYRALNWGGILLLTVPQHPWLWSMADEYACHVRRYRKTEIERVVTAAGFTIRRSTSFVSTLLPFMAMSRLKDRRPGRTFNPTAELKINPILNRILLKVLMCELSAIRAGFDFPIGGSRLIIAQKTPK